MSTQQSSTSGDGSNGVIGRLRSLRAAQRPTDAYDDEGVSEELAALFLDDADTQTKTHASTPRAPELESSAEMDGEDHERGPRVSLLVLGNLPVFAAAWASQFARDRQKQLGRPLGLLTVSDDSARLEVFGPTRAPVVEASSLDDALVELAQLGADLLVRLPEAEAGWISVERHVSSVTLLTGSDDPAIVAAYRSLKAIVQDAPADAELARVRVAIAGSQPDVAQDASAKLVQAATRFLGLPVESDAPIAQIDAGASAELFHGQPPAWADLPDLFAHFTGQPSVPPIVETRTVEHDAMEPRTPPKPVGFEAQGASPPNVPKPEPTEARSETQPPPGTDCGPEASGRAMPAGLTPIEVNCPYANAVGLAVDELGVLHAVAWAHDADASSSAVRDLVVASSWLRDHAQLVAVLLGRRLAEAPSVRHLVLSRGCGALGLAQGELRVHVCVPDSKTLVDLN